MLERARRRPRLALLARTHGDTTRDALRDERRSQDLFTDLVRSTERVAELGDLRWRDLLEEHNEIVRRVFARHGGREVDRAGDGFLATFEGPARAVRAALAIVSELAPLRLDVRAGIHTGEVEILDEGIGGIAVHIGARVAALATPGEVLVTRTVKDLSVGSGIDFDRRGTHVLRGVPGDWELHAAGEDPEPDSRS
jgi:class 3 adenylate cyclase